MTAAERPTFASRGLLGIPAATFLAIALSVLFVACAPEPRTEGTDIRGFTLADEAIDDDGGEPVVIDNELLMSVEWMLVAGGGPNGTINPVDGVPITLRFEPDGGIGGSGGCNGYGAIYVITGSQLAIGDVGMAGVGCDDKVAAAEGNFFAALHRSNEINLVGDELALSGPDTELIFRPAED